MLSRYRLLRFRLAVISIICMIRLGNAPAVWAGTIKLNHPLQPDNFFNTFTLSPDGQYVVYPVQINLTPGITDPTLLVTLYSVDVDGKNPTQITYPTETYEYGLSYQIHPKSQNLYYSGQKERGGKYGLYNVPIAGPISATIQLDKALPPDWFIGSSYEISTDEQWVVYNAYQLVNFEIEQETLYAVPANGPADRAIPLKTLIPDGGYLSSFSILSDNQRVIYSVDDSSSNHTFYVVSLTKPDDEPIQLNLPEKVRSEHLISDDGKHLIYFKNIMAGSDGFRAIFSVPTTGPLAAAVQLTLEPAAETEIGDYALSADRQSLLYSLYPSTNTLATFYHVPLTGPATASFPLNSQAIGGQYIIFSGDGWTFAATPNNQAVIYKARRDRIGKTELYSVPMNGPISNTVQLSAIQISNGEVDDFVISQDSRWVVYTADQQTVNRDQLYRVPVAGPASSSIQMNVPLTPTYHVRDFQLTPDRQWVIYQTDYYSFTNSPAPDQIYATLLTGTARDSIPLTDGLGMTYTFVITPDSRKVIYLSARPEADRFELYATDLPEAPVRDALFLPAIRQ